MQRWAATVRVAAPVRRPPNMPPIAHHMTAEKPPLTCCEHFVYWYQVEKTLWGAGMLMLLNGFS